MPLLRRKKKGDGSVSPPKNTSVIAVSSADAQGWSAPSPLPKSAAGAGAAGGGGATDGPALIPAAGGGAGWAGGEGNATGHAAGASGELAIFLSPIGAPRECWLQRRDKKCIVLYDRESDAFVACARLVQNAVKKSKFWRIYRDAQALTCKQDQLTKETRLGYVGKLGSAKKKVGGPGKLALYEHHDPVVDKSEHLLLTVKQNGKKKGPGWKVRAGHRTAKNAAEIIYRSVEPTYNKETKTHTWPGMTIKAVESVKNFVLQPEPPGGQPEGGAEPEPEPELDGGSSKTVIEMGKTKDNEWELKLAPPFSLFQAFGMAVAAITAT